MFVDPIKLPEDRKLVKRLRLKLEEYKDRMDNRSTFLARYKVLILEKLLRNSELCYEETKIRVSSENKPFSSKDFKEAWIILCNYCYNEGRGNFFGTGLPEIHSE